MAGFLGVFGGLAIILSHNVWEMSWRVVITLFGWGALIKGITYVTFPGLIMRTGISLFEGKWRKISLAIALLVGCYLSYHGFGLGE
jgi:RsiW-degrading membrane proteinase PrsW (M82 family)